MLRLAESRRYSVEKQNEVANPPENVVYGVDLPIKWYEKQNSRLLNANGCYEYYLFVWDQFVFTTLTVVLVFPF
ncbi:hypothetical protein BH11BAC1_BH11BAC1_22250 [soil metagenome]